MLDNSTLPSQPLNQSQAPQDQTPAGLQSLIQRLLRVTIPDGRYFIGRFTCVDQSLNLVLSDAEEYLPSPTTKQEEIDRMDRAAYFPTSQRGNMDPPGWDRYAKDEGAAGRMIGLVLICGDDAVKIELLEEFRQLGDEYYEHDIL